MGFQLKSPEESYLWRMYQFYKKGISPREFKRIQHKDIEAMINIGNMITEKENIEKQLEKVRSQL